MKNRWSDLPFALLLPALAAGIAAADIARFSFPCLVAAAAALFGACLLALNRERTDLAWALGTTAVGIAGLMLAAAERNGLPDDHLASLLSRGEVVVEEPAMFDGSAAEDSVLQGQDYVTEIDLRGLRLQGRWRRCRGRVLLRMAAAPVEGTANAGLRFADRIRGWAEFHLPRNFENPGSADRVGRLHRQGIYLTARVKSPRLLEILPRDGGSLWSRTAASAARRLRSGLRVLAAQGHAEEAAILAAVLLGDYSMLDTDTRAAFQNSGTYHVLVVSGLHVAWIAWLLVGLFRLVRLPSGASRMLAAAVLLFYGTMIGFRAGVSRCLWMFVLYLLGSALCRKAAPANIVFASALLLLVLHPAWLWDAGYQLSFLSVTAIVLTAVPFIESRIRPLLAPLRTAGDSGRMYVERGSWHRRGRRLRTRAELLAEAAGDRGRPWMERSLLFVSRRAGGIAFAAAAMIVISLSVQLWLGPVLAYYFNRLSWIVPAANLAVVPVASLVLGAGLFALPLSSIFSAPGLLAPAVWLASRLSELAAFCSNLPGAWQRCPTPRAFWAVSGIVLLFAWFSLRWRRPWIPTLLLCLHLAGLASAAGVARALLSPPFAQARELTGPVLRLTFLDVGQGDSMVAELPGGEVWVLDAGGLSGFSPEENAATTFDIGEMVVSRYLWHRWIPSIDRIFLSHPHQDHAGGIPALLGNFPVGRFDCGDYGSTPTGGMLRPLVATVRKAGVPIHPTAAPLERRRGPVRLEVLNPPAGVSLSANDASVVLRLSFGNFTALLTGDIEKRGERAVLAYPGNLRSLLLKVAHHGSRSATSEPFLARVRPRWTVISSGKNNPFGNPADETMRRILRHGARPLLTQDLGAIFFETDGIRYALRSHVAGLLESGILPDRWQAQ